VALPATTVHSDMWRTVFRDAVHATANRGLYFRVAWMRASRLTPSALLLSKRLRRDRRNPWLYARAGV